MNGNIILRKQKSHSRLGVAVPGTVPGIAAEKTFIDRYTVF
jgi:hypothetical protein